MAVTLQWIEEAQTKAEKLDALRCAMQQCAIDMHELASSMSSDDWDEYHLDGEQYDPSAFGEDICQLLEDGTF